MKFEPADHPQFEDVGGELRYTYKVRLRHQRLRLLLAILFPLGLLIIGWGLFVPQQDKSGLSSAAANHGQIEWIVVAAIVFSVVSAAASVFWKVFVRETLALGPSSLTHRFELGPWKRELNYMPSAIGGLRWRARSMAKAVTRDDAPEEAAITASYGSYTLEFMKGISQAEAEAVSERFNAALALRRPTA